MRRVSLLCSSGQLAKVRLRDIEISTLLTNTGLQDHAIDLVLALRALPASRLLPSSSGGKNLFSNLS
jgi:hypothetical protein